MDLSLLVWMADKKEIYYFDSIIICGSETLYDFIKNKITNDE